MKSVLRFFKKIEFCITVYIVQEIYIYIKKEILTLRDMLSRLIEKSITYINAILLDWYIMQYVYQFKC